MEPIAWSFNDEFVSRERQEHLLAPLTFEELTARICQDMRDIKAAIKPGKNGILRGYRRLECSFEVDAMTFDIFLNSPFGLRGQYAANPAYGCEADRKLSRKVKGAIVAACGSTDSVLAEASMDCRSVRAWIANGDGKFGENSGDYELRIAINNPEWVSNATRLRPPLQAEVEEHLAAILGVRAPTKCTHPVGARLCITGGWLNVDGDEHVLPHKEPLVRAQYIKRCGWQ